LSVQVLLHEAAEELFEDAPCSYVLTAPDGTLHRINRTFERWLGLGREGLLGKVRLQQLLTPGGQIYWETHLAPLLHMQGEVREIALEFRRADGTRLPALLNAVVRADDTGTPQVIRATIFDATERRRYERELLRASEREREIARQLQTSMLSGELPRSPQLDVGVCYRPAVSGLEAGGDWYDAFWLDDDRQTVALAVGDVVGRGIEAATTMSQLRSAVRALAVGRRRPGQLLADLGSYARRHELGLGTSVVYAEYAIATRELRFACAGHLPPLIVEMDSEPWFAWEGRSTLLAAAAAFAAGEVAEAAITLPPNSTIALYTDGLVERRGESIDAGLGRLAASAPDLLVGGAASAAARVVRALQTADGADDVCLLLARV
jgi:sigma-B regulation protein RsbU (phosphoserine phosphatase)